jgi:DNA-binding transcriptional LysR family regulator
VLSQSETLALVRGGRTMDVVVRPRLRINAADALAATLLEGHAAGPVQELLVSEHLHAGRLVRILPDYEVKPTEAFIAYPSVRFMRPAVRAFTDFAVPALRAVDGIWAGEDRTPAADAPARAALQPQ